MNPKRNIHWEKWQDPFAGTVQPPMGDHPVLTDSLFSGPACLTPIGIVPVHESNSPSSLFDLWVGHTNFKLDAETAQRICDEPGVEAFDVLSTYRFRIAVARQFQSGAVKKGIEVAVSTEDDGLPQIRSFLSNIPGEWALFVFPDGSTTLLRGPLPLLTKQVDRLRGMARRVLSSYEAD